MRVAYDDPFNKPARDAHFSQEQSGVGRWIDHDATLVDPDDVPGSGAFGVEPVGAAKQSNSEDWWVELLFDKLDLIVAAWGVVIVHG